jgi:hypothetical protein
VGAVMKEQIRELSEKLDYLSGKLREIRGYL